MNRNFYLNQRQHNLDVLDLDYAIFSSLGPTCRKKSDLLVLNFISADKFQGIDCATHGGVSVYESIDIKHWNDHPIEIFGQITNMALI